MATVRIDNVPNAISSCTVVTRSPSRVAPIATKKGSKCSLVGCALAASGARTRHCASASTSCRCTTSANHASNACAQPALIDATVNGVQAGLLANETPDTISLIWLTDHSRTADVVAALNANATTLGIDTIYSGAGLQTAFNGTLNYARNRRPDIIIQPKDGVIYTTSGASTKKCEHGSFKEESVHVPLIVAGPHIYAGTIPNAVDLRQVAPTVLMALKLNPGSLQAVVAEGTCQLPKISDGGVIDLDCQ